MLAVNTILQNRYLIKRPLASGGMGAVYEAEDQRLGNVVALKEIHEKYFTNDYLRNVFEREARLLASLRHHALPKVIDHFSEGAGQFLVMEFITGNDLEKVMEIRRNKEQPKGQPKPFAVADVLRWADVLLDALDYLHTQDQPIIHRDIKPSNIKVTPRGQIILLDFGLAKGGRSGMTHLFTKGSIAGYTPNYAPIEQILGADLNWRMAAEALMTVEQVNRILEKGSDPASDLYSLAATVYHLLTSVVPESSIQRLLATLRGQPDSLRPANELNPAVPNAIAAVLHQAMALYREQRPASAVEMREALSRIGNEPTIIRLDQQLRAFEFDTVTVDDQGTIIERHKGQARYYVENLGGGVTFEMVAIPGGTFTMGSPENEADLAIDEGQHQVTVSPFYIGKYEVTQAQWRAVANLPKVIIDLNPDPSHFKGDNLPVEQVSWEDATEFCERLSKAKGKTYRLPTEAEWEYACRAGTTTPFVFGETITPELANYDGKYPYGLEAKGEYRQKTTPVGSLGKANGFGLFDMHGNVWEWCSDWYSENYYGQSPSADPTGPSTGSARVIRGGGWSDYARYVRSAFRAGRAPDVHKNGGLGFRLVRTYR